jgi:AbrB family looped-hinge helix DNA binding protein
MKTIVTLDKAGRLILPKKIRDRLNLQASSRLSVETMGDKIELTPVAPDVTLVRRGNRRVIVGWEGFNAAEAVREMREDQVNRLDTSTAS